MKTIYKSLIAATILTPMLSGCVEEVFPTNGVTEEQVLASPTATEAFAMAMPAYLNNYQTVSDNAYDWGYGSVMHVRDVMTSDYAVIPSGYDWYTSWENGQYLGEAYAYGQFIWNLYNQLVQTTNILIGSVNPSTATEEQLVYLGQGYAFRASHYLDLARMYEFLENGVVSSMNADGNNVLNLTVPIVTEKTTEEQARNNPRVSRQEMFDFILSDLQKAEEYLADTYYPSTMVLPSISVVYGLYARLYMWVENYPMAAQYAGLAKAYWEAVGGYVTTEDEWLSTSTGFNDINTPSWMWGSQMVQENDVVQSGILNWTSWVSNETWYGYAAAEPAPMISAAMYDRMSDTDFRKLSYIGPYGSALYGQEPLLAGGPVEYYESYWPGDQEYWSLKFRPAWGNSEDYNVGSASAYPLMRLEEMYLIEAEAVAHSNPNGGKALLEEFMVNYRDPEYTCSATSQDDIIEEIFFQKCVELWGEGQSFYDYKRLGMPIIRGYEGTNFEGDAQFNTPGRSAYMNFVIVQTEQNNNKGLMGYNNPDPSGAYPTTNF